MDMHGQLYTTQCLLQTQLWYFHTNVPFNFGAIFYRIRILLHKLEPNGNLEKWNRNQKEHIVPFFFVISVTCDSPTGSQYV